jgi:hypothetical protein
VAEENRDVDPKLWRKNSTACFRMSVWKDKERGGGDREIEIERLFCRGPK